MWFRLQARMDEVARTRTFQHSFGEVQASRESHPDGDFWVLGSSVDWSGKREPGGRRWERWEPALVVEPPPKQEDISKEVSTAFDLSLLQLSLRELKAEVDVLSSEHLAALLEGEKAGKNRAGALSLLEGQLEARREQLKDLEKAIQAVATLGPPPEESESPPSPETAPVEEVPPLPASMEESAAQEEPLAAPPPAPEEP